jgi:hypothetical protein
MLLVLQVISPGIVELWEAVVTFVQVRIEVKGESYRYAYSFVGVRCSVVGVFVACAAARVRARVL